MIAENPNLLKYISRCHFMASRFIMSEIDSTFITRVVQSLLQD